MAGNDVEVQASRSAACFAGVAPKICVCSREQQRLLVARPVGVVAKAWRSHGRPMGSLAPNIAPGAREPLSRAKICWAADMQCPSERSLPVLQENPHFLFEFPRAQVSLAEEFTSAGAA